MTILNFALVDLTAVAAVNKFNTVFAAGRAGQQYGSISCVMAQLAAVVHVIAHMLTIIVVADGYILHVLAVAQGFCPLGPDANQAAVVADILCAVPDGTVFAGFVVIFNILEITVVVAAGVGNETADTGRVLIIAEAGAGGHVGVAELEVMAPDGADVIGLTAVTAGQVLFHTVFAAFAQHDVLSFHVVVFALADVLETAHVFTAHVECVIIVVNGHTAFQKFGVLFQGEAQTALGADGFGIAAFDTVGIDAGPGFCHIEPAVTASVPVGAVAAGTEIVLDITAAAVLGQIDGFLILLVVVDVVAVGIDAAIAAVADPDTILAGFCAVHQGVGVVIFVGNILAGAGNGYILLLLAAVGVGSDGIVQTVTQVLILPVVALNGAAVVAGIGIPAVAAIFPIVKITCVIIVNVAVLTAGTAVDIDTAAAGTFGKIAAFHDRIEVTVIVPGIAVVAVGTVFADQYTVLTAVTLQFVGAFSIVMGDEIALGDGAQYFLTVEIGVIENSLILAAVDLDFVIILDIAQTAVVTDMFRIVVLYAVVIGLIAAGNKAEGAVERVIETVVGTAEAGPALNGAATAELLGNLQGFDDFRHVVPLCPAVAVTAAGAVFGNPNAILGTVITLQFVGTFIVVLLVEIGGGELAHHLTVEGEGGVANVLNLAVGQRVLIEICLPDQTALSTDTGFVLVQDAVDGSGAFIGDLIAAGGHVESIFYQAAGALQQTVVAVADSLRQVEILGDQLGIVTFCVVLGDSIALTADATVFNAISTAVTVHGVGVFVIVIGIHHGIPLGEHDFSLVDVVIHPVGNFLAANCLGVHTVSPLQTALSTGVVQPEQPILSVDTGQIYFDAVIVIGGTAAGCVAGSSFTASTGIELAVAFAEAQFAEVNGIHKDCLAPVVLAPFVCTADIAGAVDIDAVCAGHRAGHQFHRFDPSVAVGGPAFLVGYRIVAQREGDGFYHFVIADTLGIVFCPITQLDHIAVLADIAGIAVGDAVNGFAPVVVPHPAAVAVIIGVILFAAGASVESDFAAAGGTQLFL